MEAITSTAPKRHLRFIKRLYKSGAVNIEISGIYREPQRIKREGGEYAATLIITMQDNPDAQNRSKWRGKNWLGEVLTKVRDKIMSETGVA